MKSKIIICLILNIAFLMNIDEEATLNPKKLPLDKLQNENKEKRKLLETSLIKLFKVIPTKKPHIKIPVEVEITFSKKKDKNPLVSTPKNLPDSNFKKRGEINEHVYNSDEKKSEVSTVSKTEKTKGLENEQIQPPVHGKHNITFGKKII